MPNYVNNKVFLKCLVEYQKQKTKKISNKIGNIFLAISQNLLNKTNFINYSEDRKDEMVSDAVFYMVKYIDRYDITKKNPFSYFTTIAKNAFLQNINEYSKLDDMFQKIEYIDNIDINIEIYE